MSSERLVAAIHDIIRAIDLINAWVKDAGGADDALRPDTQSRSAIERQLLIISEAAIRLHKIDPAAPAQFAPSVDWPGVRGVGNFIRHKSATSMTTSTARSSPELSATSSAIFAKPAFMRSKRCGISNERRCGDAPFAEIAQFRRAVFAVNCKIVVKDW